MEKSFRADDLNQLLLLPPSLHDWLPERHLARFLVDVIAALDLSAIYASYDQKDGRGQSPYAPEMMLRVLLYGYATGVYSSRKSKPGRMKMWPSVIWRRINIRTTTRSRSSASVTWKRWQGCSRKPCCCARKRVR